MDPCRRPGPEETRAQRWRTLVQAQVTWLPRYARGGRRSAKSRRRLRAGAAGRSSAWRPRPGDDLQPDRGRGGEATPRPSCGCPDAPVPHAAGAEAEGHQHQGEVLGGAALVSVVIRPCVSLADAEALVEDVTAAPGWRVVHRVFGGGEYRFVGATRDERGLVAWLKGRPGVGSLRVSGPVVELLPRGGRT
jgi:hypothetical protein